MELRKKSKGYRARKRKSVTQKMIMRQRMIKKKENEKETRAEDKKLKEDVFLHSLGTNQMIETT